DTLSIAEMFFPAACCDLAQQEETLFSQQGIDRIEAHPHWRCIEIFIPYPAEPVARANDFTARRARALEI
ncbi:MAG TPA: hypothetical protein VMS38_25245, partial [Pseudorhodoferax sp.]|nr:hypothetical protein [Pseudorhodoferax sp.]